MEFTYIVMIITIVQSLSTQTSGQSGPPEITNFLNQALKNFQESPLSALVTPKSNETAANSTDPIKNLVGSLLGVLPPGGALPLGGNNSTDPNAVVGQLGGLTAPLLSPSSKIIADLVKTVNDLIDTLVANLKSAITKVLTETGQLILC